MDDQGKAVPSAVDYVDTWKAMEGLVDKGLVKTIGISNFNKRQIDRVVENSRIKPVVIQVFRDRSFFPDIFKCFSVLFHLYFILHITG